jgi:hypothetical protein
MEDFIGEELHHFKILVFIFLPIKFSSKITQFAGNKRQQCSINQNCYSSEYFDSLQNYLLFQPFSDINAYSYFESHANTSLK